MTQEQTNQSTPQQYTPKTAAQLRTAWDKLTDVQKLHTVATFLAIDGAIPDSLRDRLTIDDAVLAALDGLDISVEEWKAADPRGGAFEHGMADDNADNRVTFMEFSDFHRAIGE